MILVAGYFVDVNNEYKANANRHLTGRKRLAVMNTTLATDKDTTTYTNIVNKIITIIPDIYTTTSSTSGRVTPLLDNDDGTSSSTSAFKILTLRNFLVAIKVLSLSSPSSLSSPLSSSSAPQQVCQLLLH